MDTPDTGSGASSGVWARGKITSAATPSWSSSLALTEGSDEASPVLVSPMALSQASRTRFPHGSTVAVPNLNGLVPTEVCPRAKSSVVVYVLRVQIGPVLTESGVRVAVARDQKIPVHWTSPSRDDIEPPVWPLVTDWWPGAIGASS